MNLNLTNNEKEEKEEINELKRIHNYKVFRNKLKRKNKNFLDLSKNVEELKELKIEIKKLEEKNLNIELNSFNSSRTSNFVFSHWIDDAQYFTRGFNINTRVFMLLKHYQLETGLKQKDIVSDAIFQYIYEKTNSKETKFVEDFLLENLEIINKNK
jgi:hypothetical protein